MLEYPGEQLRQLHIRPLVVVVIAVDCGDVRTWIGIGGFFGANIYDVATAPPRRRLSYFVGIFCVCLTWLCPTLLRDTSNL